MSAPTTCDCGHAPTADAGIGTGYSTARDGYTRCYACSHAAELADIASCKPGDLTVAYVSGDGGTITTWSGGVLMTGVRFTAQHPWSRERWYLTAVDADGRRWTGVGACGMWACLRLTKARGVKR